MVTFKHHKNLSTTNFHSSKSPVKANIINLGKVASVLKTNMCFEIVRRFTTTCLFIEMEVTSDKNIFHEGSFII